LKCTKNVHTINNIGQQFNGTNIMGNVINNTININLNNFGKESLEHISDEFLDKCIKKLNKGMVDLLENIHYNKNVPENNNIRIKSIKQNLLEKYQEGEWIECDKNNTLDELIRKGFKILYQHYLCSKDENIEENKESFFRYIRRKNK
jgi:hypothetical protein